MSAIFVTYNVEWVVCVKKVNGSIHLSVSHIQCVPNVCTPNTILHTLPTITQHQPAVAVNNYASPAGPALPHALAETTTSSMATSVRVSHTSFSFLPACQYPAGLVAQLFCFLSLRLQTYIPPNIFPFLSSPFPLPSLKTIYLIISPLLPSPFPSSLFPIRSSPSCLHLL